MAKIQPIWANQDDGANDAKLKKDELEVGGGDAVTLLLAADSGHSPQTDDSFPLQMHVNEQRRA